MHRKLLLKFLTLLIFLFVPVCFADVNPVILAAQNRILSLIDANNFTTADTAVKQMKVRFAGDSELPKRLCRIAYKYEQVEALEQAKLLNAQIAADFAGKSDALYASLQLAKLKIYELVDAGDYKSAELAVNKMAADFAGNENLARRLWEVANRYDKAEAFEYAKALSTRIVADYPKDTYAKYASLFLAKLRICELIDEGKYEAADTAVSAVRKDFAGHKQLPRRLWEIANRYDKFKAFGYAKTLSARIAADYPKNTYAGCASLLLAKLKVFELIDAGKYESADLAVSAMTRDFAGYRQFSRRLNEIAQRYAENQAWAYARLLHGRIAADYPNNRYGPRSAIRRSKLEIYELINAGDYEAADKAFLQMKTDFAGNDELYNQLDSIGERYEIVGQTEIAKRIYRQIIEDCPNNIDSAIARAQLKKYEVVSMAESSGNYAAVDAAAIQFSSEFAVPEQRCAAMFYLAKGLYEKALTYSPEQDSAKIANYLNRIIAIQENEVIGRVRLGTVELEAYLMLATACQRIGRYADSIEYCNKILNNYPDYDYCWHIQFMVGQSYEEMLKAGKMPEPEVKAQIETAYQKVLNNYPDCEAAKLAKKWLVRNGS
jgi:tetratricopeptide (TPR) repeat protein